jgi:hypothetical protein
VNELLAAHGLARANRDRLGLRLGLAAFRAGDTLVVTKLDRAGCEAILVLHALAWIKAPEWSGQTDPAYEGPGSPSPEQSVEAPVVGMYRENLHLAEARLDGVLTKHRGTHDSSGRRGLRMVVPPCSGEVGRSR